MTAVGSTAVGVPAFRNDLKFWRIINIGSTIILWWFLFNYTLMKKANLSLTSVNICLIREVCDSFCKTFLTSLAGNQWLLITELLATSGSTRPKIIIVPLLLLEANTIFVITPKADCALQDFFLSSKIQAFLYNFKSCVTCHISQVKCHLIHLYLYIFFLQTGEASRCGVCYQWGLPRLVLIKLNGVGPVDNRPSTN